MEKSSVSGRARSEARLCQLAFKNGETALTPEVLLIKMQQVRHVGRRLRGQAIHVRLAQPIGGLAHQAEGQGRRVVARTGQETEQSVDALDRHSLRAERAE